ncbi:hypothetical protein A2U01_0041759, partial [Trifolium medium]|nr:hypothetical protein [Trifolium medium]
EERWMRNCSDRMKKFLYDQMMPGHVKKFLSDQMIRDHLKNFLCGMERDKTNSPQYPKIVETHIFS